MQKIIDVCSRVEGHGDLNIFLHNEAISRAVFEIKAYRGFENILVGKKLSDVPKIISRICGLCHASQTIASCKTIESMFKIKPNQQSKILRRLSMTGELLKSHSMHYFFQMFPDLLKIFNIVKKTPDPYQLIKYDTQLTKSIYGLIKAGNEIDILFGGRGTHLITSIPGGTIYKPSDKIIRIATKHFQKASVNLEWLIDHFINIFSSLTPLEDFSLPNISYLALSNNKNYDRYEGNLTIKKSPTRYIDFQIENHSSYFDKDPNLRGINFIGDSSKHHLNGPISRYNIVESYGMKETLTFFDYFDKGWKNNLLFANFLRLVEMFTEVKRALLLLEEPILKKHIPLPAMVSIKNKTGIGGLEAPRGILIHHYKVNNKNLIEQVKLFIATEMKMPFINEMITNYAQKLYEKLDVNIVKERIKVMIRAFDPCIACATH